MTGEIDRDFYCSGNFILHAEFDFDHWCNDPIRCKNCRCYHRKWPTREQFKEEYKTEEIPGNEVIYVRYRDYNRGFFKLRTEDTFRELLSGAEEDYNDEPASFDFAIVCCTPFGVPPNDWRPI